MSNKITRIIVVALGFLIQLALWITAYIFLMEKVVIFYGINVLLGVLMALWLIKNSKSYSFTLPWIILLLLLPLLGCILYFVLVQRKTISSRHKGIRKSEAEGMKFLVQDPDVRDKFKGNTRLQYISDFAGYPVTDGNQIDYYPLGENVFEVMLDELKKAEKFIFFEYFIIKEGKMWDPILEIMEQKVKEGVEVRVMYDDLGSVMLLDTDYAEKLEKKGIKALPFNRLNPVAGIMMNHRDHRKITVIDGKVAFSGGVNISDEYINIGSRYGHWKDNGLRVKGNAVWNYTVMFLSLWNAFRHEDEDFTKYKYTYFEPLGKGLAVPFGESPMLEERVAEGVYLNMINQAQNYLYIFTPYLLIDTDMINALTLAAKRGVDVRLIIPGVPDKKLVYMMTESYVEPLVREGVRVFKYTPGFVHAKVFVADDKMASVGTVNLDYRSLYLHFECACYMEDADVIADIKKDLVESMRVCTEATKEGTAPGFFKGLGQAILRLAAPMM